MNCSIRTAVLAAGLLYLLTPARAAGQVAQHQLLIAPELGVAIPAGQLGRDATTGFCDGLALEYMSTDYLSLRMSFNSASPGRKRAVPRDYHTDTGNFTIHTFAAYSDLSAKLYLGRERSFNPFLQAGVAGSWIQITSRRVGQDYFYLSEGWAAGFVIGSGLDYRLNDKMRGLIAFTYHTFMKPNQDSRLDILAVRLGVVFQFRPI